MGGRNREKEGDWEDWKEETERGRPTLPLAIHVLGSSYLLPGILFSSLRAVCKVCQEASGRIDSCFTQSSLSVLFPFTPAQTSLSVLSFCRVKYYRMASGRRKERRKYYQLAGFGETGGASCHLGDKRNCTSKCPSSE